MTRLIFLALGLAICARAGLAQEAPSVVVRAECLIDTHTHVFLQGEDPAAGGYDAQLLDPLADINVLKTVHFVMKDGTVFKSSTAERLP